MKKIILAVVVLHSISVASALGCTNITSKLIRGSESSQVLALQNFLYEKGYLKAKPNGYFGGGTLAAVKAYQKSLGLEQAGNVGPATRAAIKKESCGSTGQPSPTTISKPASGITTPKPETTYKPPVPVVNTPSGLRNSKRHEDLEKLLRSLYTRFNDSRGVHPVAVTETPLELCVVPLFVPTTATPTEVAVLVTPASPCLTYVDVTYLSPSYLPWIPRDPSLATSSTLTGYTITRSETNDIVLAAKSPEDGAIVKITCNFNGFCQNIKHISTLIYGTPIFSSSSQSLIIRDTMPKVPLKFYGKNFTATNTVVMLSKYTGKRYVIGTFASTNSTVLSLSATSTNQTFPCGTECSEKIPLGDYSFTITNDGGTSNEGYITLKGITTSSFSARTSSSVTPKTTAVKLGSIAISAGVPIKLKTLTLTSTSTSSVLPSKITNFVIKDTTDGTSYSGLTSTFSGLPLYENQSRVFDIYADIAEVETHQSGFITYGGYFTIIDTLTGAEGDLPVKEISFTVSY